MNNDATPYYPASYNLDNILSATVMDASNQLFGNYGLQSVDIGVAHGGTSGATAMTTGTAALSLRFPGQYFLIEQGLAYNWHRMYDQSTGRYTQPDPLGMPDGPARYAYALNNPLMYVDPDGRFIPILIGIGVGLIVDYAISLAKDEYCTCKDDGTLTGAGGYAALGAAEGYVGPFARKPRGGIGGGGPSGNQTSIFSTQVDSALHSKEISFRTKNILRAGGRGASRALPGLGAALLGYDLYGLYKCANR